MNVFVILLTLSFVYTCTSSPPSLPSSPPPSPYVPCTEVWDRIIVDDCGDYMTECDIYVTIQALYKYDEFGVYRMCDYPDGSGTCVEGERSPWCNTGNFNPPSPPHAPPSNPPIPPIAPSIAFVYLTANAQPGDTVLQVTDSNKWSAGDTIEIGVNSDNAERNLLKEIRPFTLEHPIKYFHPIGTPVVHLFSMPQLSAFYIFTPIGALLIGIVFAFIVFAIKYKKGERDRKILRDARRGQVLYTETIAINVEHKGPAKKELKRNLGHGKSRFNKPSRFAKRGHRLP
ncbi:hypothetical protein EXVG_00459 [Emiliania huxleyi virus 202]|nr:hypothetical protein EXVG_00459 [Emiliania huxleyi virus 202]AHA54288.1 putative membrane protein [Emiliania huxleyi virus 18]AHA55337.1 putative membrane protein [Emiliania huxleyi virus 156]